MHPKSEAPRPRLPAGTGLPGKDNHVDIVRPKGGTFPRPAMKRIV